MSLIDRTRDVLGQAVEVYRGTPDAARLAALRDRLDDPLRVAIAGRVKAGKSTLLNALVGERLAPTDAGECTRIVTWYADGHSYQVLARTNQGPPRQLRFSRDDGAIEIDLGDLGVDDVAQLEVSWPAQSLRTVTLIDTPGIGSLSEQTSRRSWDLLAPDDEETPADAVLYLMRHLHSNDVDFLRAFHDVEVSRPNPVNAIGILSRADEIAVGRLDAMASARRVAARLSTDPSVRQLVQSVVPVAGLLAETAATLTETEFARLRRISELPVAQAEQLLLTVDRFVQAQPELGLTSMEREALLFRFGLFGLRLSAALLRHGTCATATELSRELTERSGLGQLREVLGSLFLDRREVLKSRSALLALAEVTRGNPRPDSAYLAGAVEEIIASAHPFNELRVLSSLRAGWVTGKPDVVAELERLIGGAGIAVHQRLRLAPDASDAELDAAAHAALARWQRRAENPLTSAELVVAARVAVRSCEGMIAQRPRRR
ncbi:dynamin family protein [Actinoplanes regularis]|uniref:50S ribosome-binding GTPase n=1 Tax=Actinoplanes regularis TaxID=52697 RepID=A0A238UUQ6_9ACTN|nr:dynamin family protein [Actinoplanes regularis]GIE84376.1 GTPase [Actinoplanes regularis]SNR25925.1 50S ribosome-binding GTPase [Actinoplanes regularis]